MCVNLVKELVDILLPGIVLWPSSVRIETTRCSYLVVDLIFGTIWMALVSEELAQFLLGIVVATVPGQSSTYIVAFGCV
jgi:hypothetical protein